MKRLLNAFLLLCLLVTLTACRSTDTQNPNQPGPAQNEQKEQPPADNRPAFTADTLPRLDGSTATIPLSEALAQDLLGYTPEQAQEIATAIENGGEGVAGAEAGDGGEGAEAAEAQGAADAAAAVQDAKDEAQGEADAEAAMKEAAAHVRNDAIAKVASAVHAKREQVKKEAAAHGAAAQAATGNKIMAKVASILQAKKDAKAKDEVAKQASAGDASYIAGFKKKAEELGVDPAQLAKYMLSRKNAAQ